MVSPVCGLVPFSRCRRTPGWAARNGCAHECEAWPGRQAITDSASAADGFCHPCGAPPPSLDATPPGADDTRITAPETAHVHQLRPGSAPDPPRNLRRGTAARA